MIMKKILLGSFLMCTFQAVADNSSSLPLIRIYGLKKVDGLKPEDSKFYLLFKHKFCQSDVGKWVYTHEHRADNTIELFIDNEYPEKPLRQSGCTSGINDENFGRVEVREEIASEFHAGRVIAQNPLLILFK